MVRKLTMGGLIAVLVMAVLFAVACGEETTTTTAGGTETTAPGSTETTGAAATGEPIKIGVIASLTGTGAPPTPSILNAVQLEVDTVNAAGGIDGRPIELIIIDDKTDPATAVSVATKLITQDKVTALLGPPTPCALRCSPWRRSTKSPRRGGTPRRLTPRRSRPNGRSSAASGLRM